MAHGDLHSVANVLRLCRESRQNGCDSGAYVGTKCNGVGSFHRDETQADERVDGGGEDRAALEEDGHQGAHHHAHVACEVGKFAWKLCVESFPQNLRHWTFEQRGQDLAKEWLSGLIG